MKKWWRHTETFPNDYCGTLEFKFRSPEIVKTFNFKTQFN